MTKNTEDKRRSRGAMSRERMIDAALRILHEKGYGGLSVAAVSDDAGVSVTSLYHHFNDKAGLLKAMVEEAFRRNSQFTLGSLESASSPLAQVDAFMAAVRAVLTDEQGNFSTVLLALSQAGREEPALQEALTEARQRIWHSLAAEFATYYQVEDAVLPAHLLSAFATYSAQIIGEQNQHDDLDQLLKSLRGLMLILGGVIRPDYLEDHDYKAAYSAELDRFYRSA